MKRNLLTVVIGAVIILIFGLLLFVFQVRQSEVAVVTTFGKPVQNIDQPGAYFKWPWPIQKIYKFDERTQNFEDKFSQTLTRDNNNLIVTIYTGWKISDASAFYPKFLGSVPAAQAALENMLRNAKNAVIGQHDLSDFVNTDAKQLKFDEIETEIQQAVQADLSTNNYGISLEFLGLKKIELPESVTQSVFERMKADRQLLINKEQYANAQAAAIRIRGEAEAAAAPTLRVFEKDPDLYIFLLRIEALKESMNQKTTLIFDDRTPPFDLFQHLPTNSPTNSISE
jgi:membrane protease subunit HflC